MEQLLQIQVAKMFVVLIFSLFCFGTVWKFSNFPASLILRETNFGHFEATKSAILTIFKTEFLVLGEFQPTKIAKFHHNQKSEPPKMQKWQFWSF